MLIIAMSGHSLPRKVTLQFTGPFRLVGVPLAHYLAATVWYED